MDKKKGSKADKSSLDTFWTFWSTLPGILTGIAAVIAAITGLYLAFRAHPTPIPAPSPTPAVSPAPTKTIAAPDDVDWDKCFPPEFVGATSIEEGTQEVFFEPQAGVIRIKLTDNYQPLGAITLTYHSSDDNFVVEKVVDSKCGAIEVKDHNLGNDDWLKISFGDQKYELRPMRNGKRFSAVLEKR